MKQLLLKAVLSIGLAAGAGAVTAGPVLTFTSATSAILDDRIGSAGFSFTTSSAVTVGALDAILTNDRGALSPISVRIFDALGAVLAATTVLTTDPTANVGGFVYGVHAIAPVFLAANTTYFIVADEFADTRIPVFANGLATGGGITYGQGILRAPGYGNPTTDEVTGGALNPSFFGVNFELVAAAVPEPETLPLLAIGLLAAVGLGRRRNSHAA